MAAHPDVWGRILLEEPTNGPRQITSLAADHMTGVRLARDRQGRPAAVGIQWMGNDGNLAGLTIDVPNAIFLLSCLKSMQLDLQLPFPIDPRDPNSPLKRD